MQAYKAPVEETLFLLKDLFGLELLTSLPGYEEATEDLVEAILREGAKFCEEVLTPLNEVGEKKGCNRAEDG